MRKAFGLTVLVLASFCAGSFSTWAGLTHHHKKELQRVADNEERKWRGLLSGCEQDLTAKIHSTILIRDNYWQPKLNKLEVELRKLKQK